MSQPVSQPSLPPPSRLSAPLAAQTPAAPQEVTITCMRDVTALAGQLLPHSEPSWAERALTALKGYDEAHPFTLEVFLA